VIQSSAQKNIELVSCIYSYKVLALKNGQDSSVPHRSLMVHVVVNEYYTHTQNWHL